MKYDPLKKKEELIKKFKEKKRPDKLISFTDLGIKFEQSTFDYFRNNEYIEEFDHCICPKCGRDENTIVYDEWLGKQLWLCDEEDCGTFYEVFYKTTVTEIKIKS